jgi:D-3-phosphoglycerate dehydrogenase
MTKILANDGLSESGIHKLISKGFIIDTKYIPQDDLINVINSKKYEVLLVRSATEVRKNIIDSCPHLKIIGRGGVGMDNIDVDYAKKKRCKGN